MDAAVVAFDRRAVWSGRGARSVDPSTRSPGVPLAAAAIVFVRRRGSVGREEIAVLLEEYGLIGDLESAALVGRNGVIDWLCLPRFDSASCFSALLGDEQQNLAPLLSRNASGTMMLIEMAAPRTYTHEVHGVLAQRARRRSSSGHRSKTGVELPR
jgi:hypothetical protein